jgi:hypothetical protein
MIRCFSLLALVAATALKSMAQATTSTSYADPLSAFAPQMREELWADIDVRASCRMKTPAPVVARFCGMASEVKYLK